MSKNFSYNARNRHWPAILGIDYLDRGGLNTSAPNRAAIEYWKAVGWVTVSAHLYNPARTNANGGLRDQGVDLNTLLSTNTETHARWIQELDQLVAGLKELQLAGVVVVWRPFHEMNGDWFWWGDKDPQTFTRLWRQMFDYFTVTKGLDNLLWVYAPNHGAKVADYYPGDSYVDLVWLDAYTDFIDPKHVIGYSELAQEKVIKMKNKPIKPRADKDHPAFNKNAEPFYRIIMDGLKGEVDGAHFWDAVAQDAVFEFLYHIPGFTNKIEGRKAYMDWFGGYTNILHSADNLRVHKTSNSNLTILEYEVHGVVPSTGKAYHNRFCSIITIRNRKIIHWRDYMDSLAVMLSVASD